MEDAIEDGAGAFDCDKAGRVEGDGPVRPSGDELGDREELTTEGGDKERAGEVERAVGGSDAEGA